MIEINVLIIGSGAIGLAIGASLLSQNVNVSFFASEKTSKALKENGVKRTGLFTDLSFKPDEFSVYTDYNQLPLDYFNFIIVSTKTIINHEIAEKLYDNREILKENAKIILFQNGFGYDEEYLKYFDETMIYSTAILTGFKRHDNYISEITGHTQPLMIGSLHCKHSSDVEKFSELIASSGFPCDVSDEIERNLWSKMLFNCALNPLSTILNVK